MIKNDFKYQIRNSILLSFQKFENDIWGSFYKILFHIWYISSIRWLISKQPNFSSEFTLIMKNTELNDVEDAFE